MRKHNKKNNKSNNRHPGGRPPKYTKAEEMQHKIDEYFASCFTASRDEHGRILRDYDGKIIMKQIRPFTITGLALALDMDRRSLVNYSEKEEFFPTIKKARLKIENYLEESLISGGNSTGVIFNLKNNYGWKDKQEIEHTGTLKLEDVL